MQCVNCELRKARFLTAGLILDGWPLSRICQFLTNRFGENYYIENDNIYRASKIHPFVAHKITGYYDV